MWNRVLYFAGAFQDSIADFFAKLLLLSLALAERHAHLGEQAPTFVVGLRGGHDGDLETAELVDLVVVDLGKDDLLAQAE